MADLLTIEEKLGRVEGKKIAWFGDSNNVSNTFVQAADIFEFELVLALPEDIHDLAPKGANVTADAVQAAKDADVLVTDTWVSMGQEGKEIEKFWPYQVNDNLMSCAKDSAIFMHCLPIHEWEEVKALQNLKPVSFMMKLKTASMHKSNFSLVPRKRWSYDMSEENYKKQKLVSTI